MSRIAIVAALPGELKPLVRGWTHSQHHGVDLWSRQTAGVEVIAACAGAGAKAAGRALAEVFPQEKPTLVISVGWAGALTGGYRTGEAYPVSAVIDAGSGERFSATLLSASAHPAPAATLVTIRTVAGIAEKRRLATTHSAGLVDMEATAVARWAAAHSVPFACIKAISDGPQDPLPDFNPFLSESGQFLTGRFVLFALVRPALWPVLIRMGRHSSRAAQSLAKYLGDVLTQQGKRF